MGYPNPVSSSILETSTAYLRLDISDWTNFLLDPWQFEDITKVIGIRSGIYMYIEGHTIQEPKENGQTDKQWSTKHNTENLRLFNMNSIKN